MSQKAPDDKVVPLCRAHHEELGKLGRRAFETKHDLNLWVIAERLALKPRIIIDAGHFVALIEGEHYFACACDEGLKLAVRYVCNFRREQLRGDVRRRSA